MAGKIVLLDDLTASRIAAGEVVERPASVVKELLENAIDAGAQHIVLLLEDGGKRRIEVSDDGCGMDAEDAVLAVQRHATSKIRSAEDLEGVATLGFRGEALPSIASVSHFTLMTKPPGAAAGVRLVLRGGALAGNEEIGCRDGTTVVVEELFFNTPARLKFLKSTATELSRCLEAAGMLAASYPAISFRVLHNGQEVLSTPGSGDLVGVLARVWGREVARALVPVHEETPHLRISGVVGSPQVTRPGRSHQFFVVCGRPVRNRILGHAVEQAFRDVTPEARYPVCCLHVQMDPRLVDVNVHPAKLEVKFRNEQEIHSTVGRAVRRVLVEHGHVPDAAPREALTPTDDQPAIGSVTARLPEARGTLAGPRTWGGIASPAPGLLEGLLAGFGSTDEPLADTLRGFRVLGQANRTYIVAETERGVAFVDQHVAHERVLYERLTASRTQQGIPSQQLAVPVTVSLGAAEFALVCQRLNEFAAAGWDLEPFGGNSLVLRAVPSLIKAGQYEAILRDMVDELVHQSVARRLVVERDQVTIAHACRLAVKAGDELSVEEMKGLLEQLAETRNPQFCPHGRPAAVLITFAELERRFKRG